jgi:hypothetical protein
MSERKFNQMGSQHSWLIGYILSIKNEVFGLACSGTPSAVCQELEGKGFDIPSLLEDQDTEILAKKFYSSPEIRFSGGDFAAVIFELLEAIEASNLGRVEALIKENSRFSREQNPEFAVPLLAAMIEGNSEIVKALASRHVGIDLATTFGMTPLHWASALGRIDLVEVLLEFGSDGSRRSDFYVSPAELAALNGNRECWTFLDRTLGSNSDPVTARDVISRLF